MYLMNVHFDVQHYVANKQIFFFLLVLGIHLIHSLFSRHYDVRIKEFHLISDK